MREHLVWIALRAAVLLCLITAADPVHADCAAWLEGSARWYPDRGGSDDGGGYQQIVSAIGEIECSAALEGGQALSTHLFVRAAQHDSARTHWDVRQLVWTFTQESLQLRAGIDQVFWGVTEFAHLVDVVNQADVLEDPFGEIKLGQPMLSAALRQRWGTLMLLGMPLFRDRSFPDPGDPLRPAPPADLWAAHFESERGRDHFDWALRYALSTGPLDLGVSYFSGTARDPLFIALPAAANLEWHAFYPQISQFGLDLQLSFGEWLFKFEGVRRTSPQRQHAWSVGLERMLASVRGSAADLTVVAEYVRDQRTPAAVPGFLQDDWSIGLRLAMNDSRTTEARLGVIVDHGHGSRAWAFELSARVHQHWRVATQARIFTQVAAADPLRAIRDDGYLDVSVTRYF